MKNIKFFENYQENELPKNKAMDEIKEAFLRFILNGAKIKLEDVQEVHAFNKYTEIKTKFQTYSIDYDIKIIG